MLIDNKSIAIVGGGPGRTYTGKTFTTERCKCKSIRKILIKNARVQGSPLDMHEDSGLAAIHKTELLEEFKRLSVRVQTEL